MTSKQTRWQESNFLDKQKIFARISDNKKKLYKIVGQEIQIQKRKNPPGIWGH